MLEKLDVPSETIIETILTTYHAKAKTPNAAAVGVRLRNGKIIFRLHKDTDTYVNIQHNLAGVINFISDLWLLTQAALVGHHEPSEAELDPALFTKAEKVNAPKLSVADTVIEIVPEKFKEVMRENELGKTKVAEVVARPIHIQGKTNPQYLIRGKNPVLEAVVYASKIPIALQKGRESLAQKYRQYIESYCDPKQVDENLKRTAQFIQRYTRRQFK